MNQIEVKIMGHSYLLGCPEGGEERLHLAVQRVDQAMCKIRDAGKVRARDRIAVLAALNLAFDLSDRAQADAQAALAQTSNSSPVQVASPKHQADLAQLLLRLDDALNEDGQLL
jgi:cell division protein ZapA